MAFGARKGGRVGWPKNVEEYLGEGKRTGWCSRVLVGSFGWEAGLLPDGQRVRQGLAHHVQLALEATGRGGFLVHGPGPVPLPEQLVRALRLTGSEHIEGLGPQHGRIGDDPEAGEIAVPKVTVRPRTCSRCGPYQRVGPANT